MINFSSSNGILTLNISALAENYRLFQTHVGTDCHVAGVVKANAYGVGLEQVSAKLKKLGCQQFFVATLDEAIKLRQLDNQTPIAVFGGLMMGAEKEYPAHNITPVLNTPNDIERWQALLAQQENQNTPVILHFDTGINRLGLNPEETRILLENKQLAKALNVQMIISHFACADEKDRPLTQEQADNFYEVTQNFPNARKSLANSSGLFRDKSYHYDMVRPGYALYGGNPTPETNNPMRSVVSLHTPILQVHNCKKGESTGYGATHIFDKDTRTATVPIGYADGFLRSNSSKATLYYEGQPCPVLGRVSMDLVTIDVSNIQGKQPEQGDAIEILGENQSVDDLAESAGTIGYEILTSLGARYKREYI